MDGKRACLPEDYGGPLGYKHYLVERRNWMVKRYNYEQQQQLKEHLYNFLNAYNFAKRLKTLKEFTLLQIYH